MTACPTTWWCGAVVVERDIGWIVEGGIGDGLGVAR
jgi:hypothetical protein